MCFVDGVWWMTATPDMFFGGGGGRQRGPDAQVHIDVTLEDLYNGAERSARYVTQAPTPTPLTHSLTHTLTCPHSISRKSICPKCRGTGAKDGKTKRCPHCGGKGVKMVHQQMAPGFTVQMQQKCEVCGGKGVTYQHKCPHCHGHKVVPETKTLTATIERGMPSDHQIRFERESEQQPGVTPGDVIFQLRQRKHPRFERDVRWLVLLYAGVVGLWGVLVPWTCAKRCAPRVCVCVCGRACTFCVVLFLLLCFWCSFFQGNDLKHDMHISLRQALLGFTMPVRHLDGRDVEVTQTGITRPFQVKTLKGEGMPIHNFPSEFGNLHVKFHIDMPRKLTAEQREAIERLF